MKVKYCRSNRKEDRRNKYRIDEADLELNDINNLEINRANHAQNNHDVIPAPVNHEHIHIRIEE